MSSGLSGTAGAIVSGLHQSLDDSHIDTRSSLEISEAVRLAGLTYSLSQAKPMDSYKFSHLSFEAERSGVSNRSVLKLVDEILEPFEYRLPSEYTTEDTVELLGMIHSLGCYSLPLSYNKGTSQKPLGAFYTPSDIADYIVSLTLSPTLNRLAYSASRDGLSALEKILNLRTLDPACGTGVFLVSAMNAYTKAMQDGIQNALSNGVSRRSLQKAGVLDFSESIRNNMFGVDIDSGALEVADVSLRLLSRTPDGHDTSTLGKTLKRGNSLVSLKGLRGESDHSHYFSDASSRSPFEWYDEFREILETGGFDFILMNPPYERLKPNLAEFLRERLLTGERDIHMENFSKYKERLNEDVEYFRKSGEYELGNRYSIDTHRLFVERTLQLSREGSSIGFIVPSTILGDISSQPLRVSIIQENRLQTVDDFPETSRLFDGVTQSVSVLTLERGGKTKSFLARFKLDDLAEAKSRNQIQISADKIEQAVGSTLSIPQVDKVGLRLISKLHRQPSISLLDWIIVKRGELDLTLNRDCITSAKTDFRLVRGSNITRYTLIDGKKEFVDITRLREKLGRSTRAVHINQPRIACQQVSNRTQRWRLKFAAIPPGVVLANSCNYIVIPMSFDESQHHFLLGLLNSELLNWRFDLTNTNNHVSNRELTQLPIPESNTSQFRRLASLLSRQVKEMSSRGTSPLIEAIAFALYGFSKKDAEDVLRMRSAPKTETNSILEELGFLLA